jgi:hypothetical protein
MSNLRALPDVIVERDGLLRLVSADAKSWTDQNTNIRDCGGIRDIVRIEDGAAQLMSDDGMVVMRRTAGRRLL